jgi:type II secretory pathway component GspD/PulD (secretin)
MKLNPVHTGRRTLTYAWMLIATVLMLTFHVRSAGAQTQQAENEPAEKPDLGSYQTLSLANVTESKEGYDIVTDLRNMLPRAKIYYVESENVISMRGTPEDFQLAQKLLSEIDKPRRAYRLTYTIANIEDGKRVGAQSFALIAIVSEGKTILKQGNKIPIVVGTENKGASAPDTQVQYEDIGLNIEASLEGYADGVRLRTKVDRSSVADERSGSAVADPVIHQTVLEATSDLQQGKPVVLGSLALPGNTGHEEVEVVSEPVQ